MVLNELILKSFKNYDNCSFNFNSKFNFIYGNNGNGKTNLLESISMLCLTKSFLNSSDSDCIRYGSNNFSIKGNFSGIINEHSIDYIYESLSGSKKVFLDKNKVKRNSEVIGIFPLVALSPKDAKIVNGSPADRRRNFDMILSQDSRLYLDHLKNYNRILDQRNVLLKENIIHKRYSVTELKNLLEPWTENLAELGTHIILKRLELVSKLSENMVVAINKISSNDIFPLINYRMFGEDIYNANELNYSTIKDKYIYNLDKHEYTEIKRGVSMIGPHRDDYMFYIKKGDDVFELKYFGSQGEQKTYLIALKVSEFNYLKERMDLKGADLPIILLDDLFSELDNNKINNITELFKEFGQIYFTTTNKEYVHRINEVYTADNFSCFNIVNGKAQAD